MGTTTTRKISRRFLRLREVCERTGYSAPSIYRLARQGRFPKHVKLGGGLASGWLEDEIDAWLDERIAERDRENAPVAS